MRPVTDILMGIYDVRAKEQKTGPVAYILHSTHHEVICPWCAESLGAVVMEDGSTYLDLYSKLYNRQAEHMLICPEGKSTTMKVEVMKNGRTN